MNVTLRLRYGPTPLRPPAAWFVVGAAPPDWVVELASWQTGLQAARLHIVPRSTADRTPCGALVVGASPQPARPAARVLAYGVVANRLYLPVEARLEPEVGDRELESLLGSGDTAYVWHPQAGLIALDADTALSVADLLAPGRPATETWDAAVPGVALNAKLISIEPDQPPTVEQMLDDARGDIGSKPLDLPDMPPAPNEPTPGALGAMGRALEHGLAKAAQWFARQMPQSGTVRNWINSLEDWATGKLGKLADSLAAARNRELMRLMNLLKNNPDEGLRFALPMGGGEHRGVAPPSGRLGSRNVDFNLRNMGGGGPADFWDMPPDFQRELIQCYRELAAREIALGRHRRAAYIFATLLNDLRSAASTLIDGEHWREAAVLYRDRLNRPDEAAACLRKGGLWTEAIAMYESLGEWETVGDIHAEIGQPEAAAEAWRRAAANRRAAADVLAAARILEHKLRAPDEAYDELVAAWPRSKQADACVTAAFELLVRQARHDRAAQLVSRLAEHGGHADTAARLVDLLAAQARNYPADEVQELAADQTRVLAADRLSAKADDAEVRRLVAAVARLAPEDRLLQRDGQRYVQRRQKPLALPTPSRAARSLTVYRELRLPPVDWKAAACTDDAIYLAGFRDRELVVARTDWHAAPIDEPIGKKWEIEPGHLENPIALTADALSGAPLVVHVCGTQSLKNSRWFKTSDRFPEAVVVGSHRGISGMTYGICYSGRDTLHIVDWGPDATWVINAYLSHTVAMTGLISIEYSTFPSVHDDELHVPLPIIVREQFVCVGLGQNLCFARRHGDQRTVETSHPITQIIGSAPHTRPRIIAAMRQGGLILWGDDPNSPTTPFASEMVDPRIALTRDGSLVAASKDEIDVYATRHGRLQLTARCAGVGSATRAVLAPRQVNHFAILSADGRLAIYRCPEAPSV